MSKSKSKSKSKSESESESRSKEVGEKWLAYNEQLEKIQKEMRQYVRSRNKKTSMWIIPGPITLSFD